MRRRRKREDDMGPIGDINVTSLVDIMMALLIIFIIVAPMIEQGIDVTLPTAKPQKIDVSNVVTIAISSNERIYFENQRVTIEDLRQRLESIHASDAAAAVLIKADEEIQYGRVVQVLDAARNAGISRLAMATKPAE
ncbi:biopolymer transporter ExbD [bacterium]|nr:biopolymer transporter ExbD [bacterium]